MSTGAHHAELVEFNPPTCETCGQKRSFTSMVLEPPPRRKPNDWIYIYFIRGDLLVYDRTVSRMMLNRAEEVVEKWRDRGYESFYTIGFTIPGALS